MIAMSPRSPRAFGLLIDPEQLLPAQRYPFGAGPGTGEGARAAGGQRVLALARALAASPIWQEMDEAILVARTEPPEGLAFLGRFSDEEAARLQWLPAQLQSELPYFRYVSWRQAEADVEELACQLLARFGRDQLRRMRFVGIPRGGLIVLGMLSYALGLGADCLDSPPETTGPLVIVDDCALSGLRFREFLHPRATGTNEVIFAHLYSHPDLRREIEKRESQVVAAMAARDLRDVAAEIYGEDLPAWRSRWSERNAASVYMIGRFEHLTFPWAEPDLTFWDEYEQRERAGWRVAPPEACLKNRATTPSGAARLQVQGQENGSLQLTAGSFYGEIGGQVLVAQLESGRVISLDGVAADVWRSFLRAREPDAALDDLQAEYGVSREVLRDDAARLLEELAARGVLTCSPLGQPSAETGPRDA